MDRIHNEDNTPISPLMHHELFHDVLELAKQHYEKELALPVDYSVLLSSTKPWLVDFKNRDHCFIWLPTAQTLSFEDYGSGPVQAQVWTNIGMPENIRVFCPSSTSLVLMIVRCTNKVIP